MAMSVTVLGCSGTYAGPGGACSGYLVRAGGVAVLLDAGPGTLANLQQHLALTDLDAVILSHVHPDHWLEVPVLRNALHHVHDVDGLALFGTAEVLARAEDLISGGLRPTFRAETITDGSELNIGPMRFRTSRTDHPPETLAVRIDCSGASLAYSADTGPRWSPAELGTGLDLVISEATFPASWHSDDGSPDAPEVHLSATDAGCLAREAGAHRLVVTHVLPTVEVEAIRAEASEAFGNPVEAARLHRTFQL